MTARSPWNPYVAGVALGLVLLAAYLSMGFGIGASSATTRLAVGATQLVAPAAVAENAYFAQQGMIGASILEDWMVFEVFGVLLGGIVGAYSAGRLKAGAIIGAREDWPAWKRLGLALLGGIIMGVAARLARGCTSGQALTGGALLSVGSWIFMLSVFAGGYLTVPFVKRQWS